MIDEEPTNTLALDLAGVLGWSIHIESTNEILSGTKSIKRKIGKKGRKTLPDEPDEHPGTVFLNMHKWLRSMLKMWRIKTIVIEKAMVGGWGKTNYDTTGQQRGLAGIVMLHAANRDIEVIEDYTAATIKKSFTGSGKAQKEDMVAVARKAGFKVQSHDEADAIALLSHHLGTIAAKGS